LKRKLTAEGSRRVQDKIGNLARLPSRGAGNTPLSKSDVTRERILDAAATEFRNHGYAGARLSDIAARIGMKAGSLYYHFESREALVEAVMARGIARTQAALEQKLASLPEDASHLTRIEAAIETHLLLLLQQGDSASASIKLIWQVPLDVRERALAQQRAYGALWSSLLNEARQAGAIRSDVDLSVVRMAILGALNWALDWYKPQRGSPKKIARDIAATILSGLAKRS
jgi:TetR/AcrR family transcriptional regulator, cholesterol catabolism regulator